MTNTNKRLPRWTIARRIVQVLALLLFCLPPLVAGWGLLGLHVGDEFAQDAPAELPFYGTLSSSTIGGGIEFSDASAPLDAQGASSAGSVSSEQGASSEQGSQGLQLLDPFAMLQIVAASKTFALEWLLFALPVLVVYGLIRGRAFCGWVCPVNLLLELVNFLREKLRIEVKDRALPRHAKLWVALGVLVVSALVGVPVFEALSPVSAINKFLVLGSTVGLVVLAAIVVLELFWGKRVWCRALCPLGGFYEVLGKVGLVNVHIDHEACIGCNVCKKACLCDPEILDAPVAGEAKAVCAGDCMMCGACVDACPTHALKVGFGR